MGTSSEKGEWTKDLGSVWFMCIFMGVLMGGVGLILTIPMAIVWTLYAFWAEVTGKKSQPAEPAHHRSQGGRIENINTMDIPYSGNSAAERAAEYRRRGQSPSGVIGGIYNDTYRPSGVPYNDGNRDWDADA
jgi:hypothetical protein